MSRLPRWVDPPAVLLSRVAAPTLPRPPSTGARPRRVPGIALTRVTCAPKSARIIEA